MKDIGKAMMIMELPAGANQDKKDIAMENLKYMMDNAHAIRCPGRVMRFLKFLALLSK